MPRIQRAQAPFARFPLLDPTAQRVLLARVALRFPGVDRMLRSLCLAAALSLSATDALAQTAPARKTPAKPKRPPQAPSGDSQAPSTSTKTGEQGTTAAPAQSDSAAGTTSAPAPAAAGASTAQAPRAFDQEEFRRQVMEEVRRELQKTKDEVKQETAWVEQDSQARVQDSEAGGTLQQRVQLFP